MEISMKGKVSILGDTARANEVFGPFPSPTCLPSLHQLSHAMIVNSKNPRYVVTLCVALILMNLSLRH